MLHRQVIKIVIRNLDIFALLNDGHKAAIRNLDNGPYLILALIVPLYAVASKLNVNPKTPGGGGTNSIHWSGEPLPFLTG